MTRRILIIVNRKASRCATEIDRVKAALVAGGLELVEVAPAGRDETSAIIRAHAGEVDAIVVAGGDGTLNAAAAGLAESGLPLGIIPLGTANDLARTLGITGGVDQAIAVILAGRTRRIDLGRANDTHFFNVASIGLSARIARELKGDAKKFWGVFAYAITAVRTAIRSRPFRAHLTHDGDTRRVWTLQISVGNGRYYGGGLTVAEDAAPDDGRLDAYSIEVGRAMSLLWLLPSLRRGTLHRRRHVRTFTTTRLSVITRRPRHVDVDGDLALETPVTFTVDPGAVEVFVPSPEP